MVDDAQRQVGLDEERAGSPERERTLVERCRQHDDAAWAELYRDYAPRVHRFVGMVARPDADREDLVQRVFIEFLRTVDGYRGEAALHRWLFRLAARVVAKDARSEVRRRSRDGAWQLAWSVVRGDCGWSPDRILAARRELASLELALADLPVEQRLVWVMREVEGLDVAEVATALACSVASVRVRHFRARRRLLDALDRAAAARETQEEAARAVRRSAEDGR